MWVKFTSILLWSRMQDTTLLQLSGLLQNSHLWQAETHHSQMRKRPCPHLCGRGIGLLRLVCPMQESQKHKIDLHVLQLKWRKLLLRMSTDSASNMLLQTSTKIGTISNWKIVPLLQKINRPFALLQEVLLLCLPGLPLKASTQRINVRITWT